MTKRERELFNTLKRLRDALWDSDIDGEKIPPKLNRAYIAAGDLIAKIQGEARTRSVAAESGVTSEPSASRERGE